MKDNRHSQAIPAAVLEAAQTKIAEAAQLLGQYLIALTPTERQEIPKMGPKTLNFVEKAHEYAHENQNLVPPYLNMAAFDADFADAHGLWHLIGRVHQLSDGVLNTQMVAGSEAYQAALIFYNSVKVAANQDINGAEFVYEELKKRFPGGKRRYNSEPEE